MTRRTPVGVVVHRCGAPPPRDPGTRDVEMEITALAEPPPVAVDPLVSLRDVDQVFTRRGRTVTALAGLDLAIGAGEVVSLLGPSGCGKSTLLRIIGGLQRPARGVVRVAGGSADAARAGKQYGLGPQSPALVPWKTVAENVRFLSGLHRSRGAGSPTLNDDEIAALLDAVG